MTAMGVCPQGDRHMPCPEGYIQWHAWAAEMGKTHRQTKCSGCGLYAIWIPKRSLLPTLKGTTE